MAEDVKDFIWGMPIFMYIILFLSFGLLVASFVVPPLGVISPSVLQGSAIILGATWLFYTTCNLPTILQKGKIKASYGNAQIEIANKDGEEDEKA